MIIDGVDISRVFTADEVFAMYTNGKLRSITLQGYAARADYDGTVRFVHHSKLNPTRGRGLKPVESGEVTSTQMQGREFSPPPGWAEEMAASLTPIRRRTPQERVESMMARIRESMRVHKTVPGLSESQLQAILGPDWHTGVSEVTEDVVRRIAAHYMAQAEAENKGAGDFAIKDRVPEVALDEQERLPVDRAERGPGRIERHGSDHHDHPSGGHVQGGGPLERDHGDGLAPGPAVG